MQMEPASPPPKRLDSLDGWRAIAISLVLLSHVPYTRECPAALSGFIYDFINGNLGTRIFFTVSGFIITWLLLAELNGKGRIDLPAFYLRRSLRILPVYFGFLFVILILQVLGRLQEDSSSWIGSLSFTRNFLGRGNSPTVHFWTLAIEEQFYLFWPPILYWLHRRRTALFICIGLVILSGPLVRLLPQLTGGTLLERLHGPRSFFCYSDVLMIGCLSAILFKSSFWPSSVVRMGVAFSCMIILEGLRYFQPLPTDFLIPTFEAWATAELIYWTITHKGLGHRLLNSRPIAALGLLSFSLYVWHMIFLDHFAPGALAWLQLDTWYLWWLPSLACALISYAILEWPARFFREKRHRFPSAPTSL